MPKINISVAHCQMYVEGMDMNCPLCGALVRSGENHECGGAKKELPAVRVPKKKSKK